jgi:Zn-dependent metalloprotease
LAIVGILLILPAGYATPPRFFIAPAGRPFPVQDPVPGNPGETARHYAQENASALGITSQNVTFGISAVRVRGQEWLVHLREVYGGIPIIGTAIIVQLNAGLTVDLVINGIVPDTTVLDQGGSCLTPDVSGAQAVDFALEQFAPGVPRQELTITEPELRIFDPRRFGLLEPPRLVWDFSFGSEDNPEVGRRMLVDAHSLFAVRAYSLIRTALNRQVRDADDTHSNGSLVRDEGDPACGIADADDAYEFLEDTYDYYLTNFGRDSFDDSGHTIRATVRYCERDHPCPWANAFQRDLNNRLFFGSGMAADDWVAHEYTHAVTEHESNLIYENASGAICESLSDIFGEAVDLTNGAGSDGAGDRWLFGEDTRTGACRSMQDPAMSPFNDPDRLSSPNYDPAASHPDESNDYGGVHTNNGVSNKLFYLLTDGDSFNGYSIEGLGLDDSARLFYTANTRYLSDSADFYVLYDGLQSAANYLGWSGHDKNNLYYASKSVEIALEWDVYVDAAALDLYGKGFSNLPFYNVTDGVSAARPGDRLHIREGDYHEHLRIDERLTLYAWDGPARIGVR